MKITKIVAVLGLAVGATQGETLGGGKPSRRLGGPTSSSGVISAESPGGWLNDALPPGSSGQASLLEDGKKQGDKYIGGDYLAKFSRFNQHVWNALLQDGDSAEWNERGGLKAHDKFAGIKARRLGGPTSSSGLISADSPGGWLNDELPSGSFGQASLLEDGKKQGDKYWSTRRSVSGAPVG